MAFISEVLNLQITFDPQSSNPVKEIGEYQGRKTLGTLFPKTKDEVQRLIQIANKFGTPLYPISKGKNWGFGSRAPVEEKCFVVDLSGMNQVLKLNLETGIAIIEPGVTQVQLSKQLTDTPYLLNVTASAESSSIIGNSLERGIGQFRHRIEDIIGVEIILGKGQIANWGGFPNVDLTDVPYSSGIGPNLLSLAFQSNFGIVTSAAIALIPRAESSLLIQFKFHFDNFEKVHQTIRNLFRDQLIHTSVKIFRSGINEFHLIGGIRGRKSIIDTIKELVEKALHAFGEITFYRDEDIDDPVHPLKNYCDLFNGIPRLLIDSSYDIRNEDNFDASSKTGIRVMTLVLPTSTKLFAEVLVNTHTLSLFIQGVKVNFVFNISSANTSLLHLYFSFARNRDSINRTNKQFTQIMRKFIDLGCLPYRMDIDHQNTDLFKLDDATRENLTELKQLFDPNGIIAPGRYRFRSQ